MKHITYTFYIIAFYLIFDAFAFMFWLMSAQTPQTTYYFGCVTKYLLSLLS